MKKTIALLLALVMCFGLAACGETSAPAASEDSASVTEPAAENSVAGGYTFAFSGQMGDETFTLTLNDDSSCHLELNSMLGPWDGVYSNDGDHVSVHMLENPNGAIGKTPDLWANWFDGATGACELDLNSDGTFTFIEREGGESTAPAGMMTPGAMDDNAPAEEGYTTWTNEPYGEGIAQTFNGMMKDGPGARPVVIVVPGGAFRFVDGGRYATIAETLCEENYLVLQLNYTVGANTYPQAIIDVKTAIQYVVDNAGPLHADVSKIYVMGSSAGGYLASMAVLSDADQFRASESDPNYTFQVAGLVDFFGATQWMTDALFADVGAKAAESEWLGSDVSAMDKAGRDTIDPLTYLDGNDVAKAWISHGTGDTTMPILNSEQFYEGLKAALGEENVHFEIIEGATHEDSAFYTADNLRTVFAFFTK